MINYANKTINAWWPNAPRPGNFGDILTPWLIKKISGFTSIYQNKPFINPTLIGVGSIIQVANKDTTVWGSGLIKHDSVLNPRSTYLSVRGPLTRSVLLDQGIKCPSIFGDPALLLPKYYNPDIPKKYKIGFFAHYVDTELVKSWYTGDDNILVIDPLTTNPESVIDKVLQCEKIVSSSLHGIIVAHAYGIPACWVKHSDKLFGDDIKFHDYFESVSLKCNYVEFYEKINNGDIIKLNFIKYDFFDITPILKVFPIKL